MKHHKAGDSKVPNNAKQERPGNNRIKSLEELEKDRGKIKIDKEKIKKAAIIGAAVAGTALVVYGGYKISQAKKLKAYETAKREGERRCREVLMAYDSAKQSVEYAKNRGGGWGHNQHYSWKVDKDGSWSIAKRSGDEIAKTNARAAAEYNAEMHKKIYDLAKNGIYTTYTKAVGYDPRKRITR